MIDCINPNFIFNPYLFVCLSDVSHFVTPVGNVPLYPSLKSFLYVHRYFPSSFINKHFIPASIVRENDLPNYTFLASGRSYPLYISVPCGKCLNCINRKINTWVSRCQLESASHPYPAYFVTLTYNNENLPIDGCVDKKGVQKFLKRFRFNTGYTLRYFLTSEYGSRSHRPHYHAIFWIDNDYKNTASVLHDIEKSWNQGFVYVRPCDDNAIRYVAKYTYKDKFDSDNHNFMLCSRRPAIGKSYIDSHLNELRKFYNKDSFPLFVNGNIVNIPFNRYISDKVFPSVSRILKGGCKKVKNLVSYLSEMLPLHDMINKGIIKIRSKYYNTFINLVDNILFIVDYYNENYPCLSSVYPVFSSDFSSHFRSNRERLNYYNDCYSRVQSLLKDLNELNPSLFSLYKKRYSYVHSKVINVDVNSNYNRLNLQFSRFLERQILT